jgi:hypothetical protein
MGGLFTFPIPEWPDKDQRATMRKYSLAIVWWATKEVLYDRMSIENMTRLEEDKRGFKKENEKKKMPVRGFHGLDWSRQEGLVAKWLSFKGRV